MGTVQENPTWTQFFLYHSMLRSPGDLVSSWPWVDLCHKRKPLSWFPFLFQNIGHLNSFSKTCNWHSILTNVKVFFPNIGEIIPIQAHSFDYTPQLFNIFLSNLKLRKNQTDLGRKKGLNQYCLRISWILPIVSNGKLSARSESWFRLQCSVVTWTVFGEYFKQSLEETKILWVLLEA